MILALINNKGGTAKTTTAVNLSAALATKRRRVLLVDLDDFSRLSATLGYGVGDLVLTAAARRISESIGPQHKVGRCGIDRFIVLLADATVEEGEVLLFMVD